MRAKRGRAARRLALAGLALAGAALSAAACFQYTDTVAFENRTEAALVLHAVVKDAFTSYTCNGDGSDRATVDGEADIDIPAGSSVCLEGPAVSPKTPYDARDRIDQVEVRRDGAVCLTLEGSDLTGAFGMEDFRKVLPIDDTTCPAAPADGP